MLGFLYMAIKAFTVRIFSAHLEVKMVAGFAGRPIQGDGLPIRD
jgi:hypothetical protein